MINNYTDFEESLRASIIFRAKNFVITDCNFENLMNDVFDDIMRDVKIAWTTQTIIIEDGIYNYELENSSVDEDANTEYYGSSFDIVGEAFEDISNFMTEPEDGTLIIDEHFANRNVGGKVFVLRVKIPAITSLKTLDYRNIKTAMIEGLLYQIQDSIPSQIDGQLGNFGYQRFFAAKKVLKEKYPQRRWLDGRQVGSQSKLGAYDEYSR